jgi:NDP-sugar pyrophosphorylase family protein
MIRPTLLIMAAGLGSRYGSLKQIEPVGPGGEAIIDYSVYDAIRAGFGKVVFVIKKEIEKDFRESLLKRFEKQIETSYVFQELDMLPHGYSTPPDRVKPWGTAHAILVSQNEITTPFAALNADDFYGYDAFCKMYDFLSGSAIDTDYCMIGYKLKTLFLNMVRCREVYVRPIKTIFSFLSGNLLR